MNRPPFRAPRLAAGLAIGVAVLTFVFRFSQLGGTLGGFENDHFNVLSMARQIVGGDMPFRDYNEIGAPLTTIASAVGQMVGGYALLPDAVLTIGSIAVATATIFWLAARASGSIVIASFLTFIAVALTPRPYAYPKFLLYAVGIAAAWHYADRPSTLRLAALGSVIGVAFLFRHDHGAYLGIFGLVALLAMEGRSRLFVRKAVVLSAVAAAWVVPYLAMVHVNGGVVEYARRAALFASRDAERTSFIAPRFELGSGEPLVRLAPEPPAGPAEIKVRWSPVVSEAARHDAEARYALLRGELRDGRTWNYELGDSSTHNVAAIVRDPQVEDTDGVDRSAFAVANAPATGADWLRSLIERVRLAPELTSRGNATAWLYYLFVALAPAAAVLLALRTRREGWMAARVYILPVAVLAGVVSVTLLSRGALAIRLPDVAPPMAVLAGWMLPIGWAGSWQRWTAVLLLVVTTGAAVVLGEVPSRIETARFDGGPRVALRRLRDVASELGSSPPLGGLAALDHPGSMRVAEYVMRCTPPGNRVFVFGNYPEIYFFSGRMFAGGHVWFIPGFYGGDRDQQTIVERLQRWPVPIVVTEAPAVHDAVYRKHYPTVTAYLDRHYRSLGRVSFGAIELGVLVDADARGTGTFETAGGARLPCFASGGSLRAAGAK